MSARVVLLGCCLVASCHASSPAPSTERATSASSPAPLPPSPPPSASVLTAPLDAAVLADASSSVASASVDAGGPVDLDEFIRRWNADVSNAEYHLKRPAGARSSYEFPIGILWCSLKVATGPKGVIARATLEHTAKATLKWNCKFAEKAMLVALGGDGPLATSILERLELPDPGKATRSVTEGTLRVTRRNEEGNGDVTAIVTNVAK